MKENITPSNPKVKDKYKVKNWQVYNASLCKRGSVTIWMESGMEFKWAYGGKQKRGGKIVYSEMAIEFCYIMRCVYGLAYRQTEGFIKSIFTLSGVSLPVPCYTQIQRRAKTLPCQLRKSNQTKGKIAIVIDSTGLKVYGEGEWKVRQHGYSKHRTWRKLHIASDGSALEIVGVAITGNDVDDAQAGIAIIADMKSGITSCAGDGAYDKSKFRKCLPEGTKQLIPPRRNAVLSKEKSGAMRQRDAAIRRIKEIGRQKWKKETGYHKRSLSEVNMYRYKTIFGEKLKARKNENESIEITTKCSILNKFVQLGMPLSEKVA